MKKLTLTEIADIYGKSPRAFRDIVKRDGIPHEKLGRSMYFDLDKVVAHLTASPVKDNVIKFTPVKRKRVKSKFAEAVFAGISR